MEVCGIRLSPLIRRSAALNGVIYIFCSPVSESKVKFERWLALLSHHLLRLYHLNPYANEEREETDLNSISQLRSAEMGLGTWEFETGTVQASCHKVSP